MIVIVNYFYGQFKGDDCLAYPPNFKKKSNEHYILTQENLLKNKKIL